MAVASGIMAVCFVLVWTGDFVHWRMHGGRFLYLPPPGPRWVQAAFTAWSWATGIAAVIGPTGLLTHDLVEVLVFAYLIGVAVGPIAYRKTKDSRNVNG